MEETVSAMSQSIQAGTQVVQLAEEGISTLVKVSTQVLEYMASLIRWLWSKTAGQKLIQMGGQLKLFRVDAADMDKFQSLCRKRGIIYQTKGFDDGAYDVILSSKQMDIINDVLKRLPSMREIEFNGDEIENKAVATVNEDAAKDFGKFLTKNDIYSRRISVSEASDGQKQYSYYIHPESLKFVQQYLDRQVANPKAKYTGDKCGAYTGREFAERNRHVVVVTSDPEVMQSICKWAAANPDAGEVRWMDSGNAIAMNDDAMADFLHKEPEFKDRIWMENYADYLCKPRSNPFPVEDDEPVVNRAAKEESEAQKSVRILNAKAQPMSAEEIARAKHPELNGEAEVPEDVVKAEKAHLDQIAELGIVKRDSQVNADGEVIESYERIAGSENKIRAYLDHDAAIQDRLINEAQNRAKKNGQQPDPQTSRKNLRLVELPFPEEETGKRMRFRLYNQDGKEYDILMRKADLEIAPNGKRYAWIDTGYDYNVFSCELDRMQRMSSIRETRNANPTSQDAYVRPGMDLVRAIQRGAAANPQPATIEEAIVRERQELTGRREQFTQTKNLSFEETADVLKQQREKVFENLPQKNDFNGALNHSQRTEQGPHGETFSDVILCDRKNPQNYIRIHTEKATDFEGNTYAKNDYRVFHNATEVKESKYGHNGRFTDERFEGRIVSDWLNLRREMQEKSGISNDVLEFKSEQEFADYYQKFLGSSTYQQLKQREAAQQARARNQGDSKEIPLERQVEMPHRSNALKNGTAGAFEERRYSKGDSDALEAALLKHSKKKQAEVLHDGGASGGVVKAPKPKTPKPKAPNRKA